MLPQNNPIFDLTATTKSDQKSVQTDDDEEDDLPTCNLSTTYNEENYDKKDPIYPDKPSLSYEAQIETAIP